MYNFYSPVYKAGEKTNASFITQNDAVQPLDFDRTTYIEQTSQGSRIKAIAQTVFTGATALQLGVPTMLRGITTKDIFWLREGQILSGMKYAYGEGITDWGRTRIRTQNGEANTIEIQVVPSAGARSLNQEKHDKLQQLFPHLRIEVKYNETPGFEYDLQPDGVYLRLHRSDFARGEEKDFDNQARSLVNNLLNDPMGLMSLNPKATIVKYKLPSDLQQYDFFADNLDFFGNFGEWGKHSGRWFS